MIFSINSNKCIRVKSKVKDAGARSRWKLVHDQSYKGGGFWECTACGYKYSRGAYFEPEAHFRFCPNCGVPKIVEPFFNEVEPR